MSFKALRLVSWVAGFIGIVNRGLLAAVAWVLLKQGGPRRGLGGWRKGIGHTVHRTRMSGAPPLGGLLKRDNSPALIRCYAAGESGRRASMGLGMRWIRDVPCRVAVLLVLGGFASISTPPDGAETLRLRAQALQDEVSKAGAFGPVHQASLDQLLADVQAYNRATGRFDVSVERATFMSSCSSEAAFSARYNDCQGGCCCNWSCPLSPPNRPQGLAYICFKDDDGSFCDSRSCQTVCSYRCVKLPLRFPL